MKRKRKHALKVMVILVSRKILMSFRILLKFGRYGVAQRLSACAVVQCTVSVLSVQLRRCRRRPCAVLSATCSP